MTLGGNTVLVSLNVDCGRAGRRYYKAQNWCNLRREKSGVPWQRSFPCLYPYSLGQQKFSLGKIKKSKNQKIKIVSNQRSALLGTAAAS